MGFNVSLRAGETAARIVKAELAQIDERVEAKLLCGDILRRDED
jgi:hypothetical protein